MLEKFKRNDLSSFLKNKYNYLFKNMFVIGIVGSSGKTSTGLIMYKLFNLLGLRTSLISHYYCVDNIKYKVNDLDIKELYRLFYNSFNNKIKYVIIEIDYKDIDIYKDIDFKYMIYTNADKNKINNINEYIIKTRKLFKNKSTCIVNADDSYCINYVKRNTITYGFYDSNYKIKKYILKSDKTLFEYENIKDYIVETKLLGKYNIYNIMPSIIILDDLNIPNYLEKVKLINNIEQHYEVINYGNNKIVIDKAKSLNEIVSIINTMKLFEKNITVILNTIYSDIIINYILKNVSYCIIANNTNFEELENINQDNYEIIINEKEAIKKGINSLSKEDVLLILTDDEVYNIIAENKEEVMLNYSKQIKSIS